MNELWSEFPDFLASQREERRWFVDLLVGDRSLSYLFLCLRENRRHHTSGEEMWRLDQQMSHGSRNQLVVSYQSDEYRKDYFFILSDVLMEKVLYKLLVLILSTLVG